MNDEPAPTASGRKYSLVLFDYDYTLVDASGCLFPAIRTGLRAVGVPCPADGELKKLIGIPLDRQFRILAPGNSDFVTFHGAYKRERDAREQDGTVVFPGVPQALAALREFQVRLAIVSTGAAGRIERTLCRLGLDRQFEKIVGGRSDKAAGLADALNELRGTAATAVYVGDRPDDYMVAERAGVHFIGVCTGAFPEHAFGAGRLVIPSVAALPPFVLA